MSQHREASAPENSARAHAARLSRWLVRALGLVVVACAVLSVFGADLSAQAGRRGDVTGEAVPFAPPRPPKPTRDPIHSQDGRVWRRLINDGLHDRANPAISTLREPAKILSKLPGKPEEIGNNVDWMAALRQDRITPKDRLRSDTDPEWFDTDIIMPRTAAMPMVRFPHASHSEWLDCSNCHDSIFVKKRGAVRFNMADILEGKYCGRCHGAVAFPPTDCLRCHSVKRDVGVAN